MYTHRMYINRRWGEEADINLHPPPISEVTFIFTAAMMSTQATRQPISILNVVLYDCADTPPTLLPSCLDSSVESTVRGVVLLRLVVTVTAMSSINNREIERVNQFIPNQHLWDDRYIACTNQSALMRRWLHRVYKPIGTYETMAR